MTVSWQEAIDHVNASEQREREGWLLTTFGDGQVCIDRDDDSEAFADGVAAYEFVQARAAECAGRGLYALALNIHEASALATAMRAKYPGRDFDTIHRDDCGGMDDMPEWLVCYDGPGPLGGMACIDPTGELDGSGPHEGIDPDDRAEIHAHNFPTVARFIIKDDRGSFISDSDDRPLVFTSYEAAEAHADSIRGTLRYCVTQVMPHTLCPKCGGADIAAETLTWINYEAGSPVGFDDEDLEGCSPAPGGTHVCRACTHQWKGE